MAPSLGFFLPLLLLLGVQAKAGGLQGDQQGDHQGLQPPLSPRVQLEDQQENQQGLLSPPFPKLDLPPPSSPKVQQENQQENQQEDQQRDQLGDQQGLPSPSPRVQLKPLWTAGMAGGVLPDPEMVDLDLSRRRQRRQAGGGGEEDEQLSTFSHSYENEWVTAPQATEFSTSTQDAEQGGGQGGGQEASSLQPNTTSPDQDAPGLFNPFRPLGEGSYVAYGVLFLGGLVLAVGVVGNMAVMCVVWNNYYMRSAWNYLLASMAFWDFLVLVLCLPVVVVNQLSHRRILGDITCRMVPYMEVGGACSQRENLWFSSRC
ncbi:unnamed protein product [Menidia menidia]|uniref:(Atlantic silverside) hypothetical protein n=1 Tax=Menidia menidia TaxID=238744 RepID=A0A8S4BGN3_9TELE|nr:unnamed protein product [Menidia menidia]